MCMYTCRTCVPPSPKSPPLPSNLHLPQGPFRVRVLWLTADAKVLNSRLDARVDGMMARGLLREVEELNDLLLSRGYHLDEGPCLAGGGGGGGGGGGASAGPAGYPGGIGGGGSGGGSSSAACGGSSLPSSRSPSPGDHEDDEDPEGTSPRDGDPEAVAHGIHGLDQRQEGAAGLLIAIGYKEFAEYFAACRAGAGTPSHRAALLDQCETALKQVTRRCVVTVCARVSCRWSGRLAKARA
jgi:hypothetical protein